MTAPVETATETIDPTVAGETPTPAAENVEEVKEPVDTTAFDAAVAALLALVAADHTADRSEANLEVRKEYHEFDRAGKNVARKSVEDAATTAVMNSQLHEAQALLQVKDEMLKPLPASGQPRAPRAPKNATDDVVASIAAILLAYSFSNLRASADETLDANWAERVQEIATAEAQDRVTAFAAWLEAKQEGVEPEASDVEKAAARISLGRAPKGQGRKPKAVEEAAKAAAEAVEGDELSGQPESV